MAKSKETAADELPSAEDTAPVADAAPDVNEAPAVDASLPLFLVSANGLDSRSFHAIDESDAIRQFYKSHGVKEAEKVQPRVQRIS